MKLSKVLHVLSVISGIIGVLSFFGFWGPGMMGYNQGYTSMGGGSAFFFIAVAIWLQVATIHHMMLEKKGEIV